MAIIQFADGTKVNFNGTPTHQDVEEVAARLGLNKTAPAQPPKKNIVQKTAGALGVEKAGQGLATTARVASGSINQTGDEEVAMLKSAQDVINALQQMHDVPNTDPKKARLLQLLREQTGARAVTQAEIDPGTQLSNKEVLGSFGNVALNVATAGLPAPKGATAAVRIAKGAGQAAAVGAAQGFSQGLNDNKSIKDSIKQAGTSAVVSGGIGFGVQGLAEFGKLLTSNKVTEGIVNKNLGVSKKVVQAGKSPAGEIISKGSIKSKAGYLAAAEKEIRNADTQIATILKNDTRRVDSAPVLDEVRQRLMHVYKDALNAKDVEAIVESLPVAALRDSTSMTIDRVNNLRKVIDNNYIGSSKWLNSANATPERITALKTTANVLRGIVQDSHPALPKIFQNYSKAITQKAVLDETLSKPHILTNLLEALSSAGIGLGAGGFSPGGALKGLASFAAIKALFSTPVQTGLAIGLDRAGKLPATKVGQAARAVSRVATQRAIQAVQ